MPPDSHIVCIPKRPPVSSRAREEIGEEAPTRRPDGMAERDGAAQTIDAGGIGPSLLYPSQYDRSEGFVHLEGVDAIDRQSRALQQLASGRHYGRKHHDGVIAGDREMGDRRARLEAQPSGDRFLGDQDRRCAIGNLAGIAGGHTPTDLWEANRRRGVLERGLERRQLFERRASPQAFVAVNDVARSHPRVAPIPARWIFRVNPRSSAAAARR